MRKSCSRKIELEVLRERRTLGETAGASPGGSVDGRDGTAARGRSATSNAARRRSNIERQPKTIDHRLSTIERRNGRVGMLGDRHHACAGKVVPSRRLPASGQLGLAGACKFRPASLNSDNQLDHHTSTGTATALATRSRITPLARFSTFPGRKSGCGSQ